MNDLNEWHFTGRLTKSAETMTLQNGTTLVKFSVAVNKAWKVENSEEWKQQTSFFDVAYYGRAAKAVAEKLVKGRQVLVSSELKQNVWEKDGVKHYDINVIANKVWPLALPSSGGNSAAQEPPPPESPPDFPEDIPF